jgi:xanthine dehydrogenase accessory factor
MQIFSSALALLEAGESFALATIIEQQGSTPRGIGTQMIIRTDGRIIGTLGGGGSEAQTIARAPEIIAGNAAILLTVNMTGEDAAGSDMICGGIVRILLQCVQPSQLPTFRKLQDAENARQKGWLVTLIEGQSHDLVFVDEQGQCHSVPALPENLRAYCLDAAHSSMHTQHMPQISIFARPLRPKGRMYIFGAGHVALDTAKVCGLLGFETTVLDDRQEFLDEHRFPESQRVLVPDFDHIPDLPVDEETYIVIMTRGHLGDRQCLDWALARDDRAAYIGMIGSRHKRAIMDDRLRQQGISDERLARIHSPIGLPIQAQTPAEIAVSIAAELIQLYNKKS